MGRSAWEVSGTVLSYTNLLIVLSHLLFYATNEAWVQRQPTTVPPVGRRIQLWLSDDDGSSFFQDDWYLFGIQKLMWLADPFNNDPWSRTILNYFFNLTLGLVSLACSLTSGSYSWSYPPLAVGPPRMGSWRVTTTDWGTKRSTTDFKDDVGHENLTVQHR